MKVSYAILSLPSFLKKLHVIEIKDVSVIEQM